MHDVHICYGVDAAYMEFCLISISQVILHRDPESELYFHIIVDFRIDEYQDKIKRLNSIPHVNIETVYRNSSTYIHPDAARTNSYLSPSTVLRYTIPSLKSLQDVDRVIYLDADTVVLHDLYDLLTYPLDDHPVGMCKNPVRLVQGHLANYIFDDVDRHHFYNAAIMLMDLQKLRDINFTELCRLRALVIKEQDEPVINEIFEGDVQPLPPEYDVPYSMIAERVMHLNDINVYNMYYNSRFTSMSDYLHHARILHFLGNKEVLLQNPALREILRHLRKLLNTLLDQKSVDGLVSPDAAYFHLYHILT